MRAVLSFSKDSALSLREPRQGVVHSAVGGVQIRVHAYGGYFVFKQLHELFALYAFVADLFYSKVTGGVRLLCPRRLYGFHL
jgi:hypothetical protein